MQRSYVHPFFSFFSFLLQVLCLCDNPDLLNKDEARALFRLQTISSNLSCIYVELHKMSMPQKVLTQAVFEVTNVFVSLLTAKLVTTSFDDTTI
jgi:hypothetical protein